MYIENFRKFINYFGQRRKLKLCAFIILSLIAGSLEFLGIALIYPFVLLIVSPDTVTSTHIYQQFTSYTQVTNTTINALIVGLLALILFIAKNVYMIYFYFLQSKFMSNWRKDISKRFMEFFLFSSYKDSIKTSPADKLYILSTLCPLTINNFVFRALGLLINSVVVSMIILLILVKFPFAGLATITFVVISMLVQNRFFKNKMTAINSRINEESRIYNDITYSNIENLKEVKILSAEKSFYKKFYNQSKIYNYLQSRAEFYGSIPPYIIEILIVSSLLILGLFVSLKNINNQSAIVASFAMIVAAIFRIAPALNRIQTAIINIANGRTFIKSLIHEFEHSGMRDFKPELLGENDKVEFKDKIAFKNVNFEYNENKKILKNISFEIKKGDFIGIIGLSGAGKSTLADVLMGLLPTSSGEILVDEVKLTQKNFAKFRRVIGYVPQEIRILNASFKENVAWGCDCEDIDIDRVTKALNDAQLCDFVNQFEQGIESRPFIGSTGASLGQKQRLAIARALYRQPEILILDEATSALDVKIEHEITDMLNKLKHEKTIIAIAHRLSTLKSCNKLIYINDGQIIDIGTFDELSAKHPDFENLIKLSSIK